MRTVVIAIDVPEDVGPERSDVVDWLCEAVSPYVESWTLMDVSDDRIGWEALDEGD